MAVTVSEKPWSDYTAADYTPEQWHAACLIHQHEGAPTSKNQCKLPVKTPSGTLSRAGVHAAAAALAGARGGVNASSEEKAAAARAIVRYYTQLGEQAPPSMKQSAIDKVEAFFAHHGIKGMKWGVRRNRGTDGTVGGGKKGGGEKSSESETPSGHKEHLSADAERFLNTRQKQSHELSDRDIKEANNRAEALKKYNQLFNDPNAELRAKVDGLKLQQDYRTLNRQMNPTAMDKVARYVQAASKGYKAYEVINKKSNGELNDVIARGLGLKSTYVPKHLAKVP
jgi:hypothetical protein